MQKARQVHPPPVHRKPNHLPHNPNKERHPWLIHTASSFLCAGIQWLARLSTHNASLSFVLILICMYLMVWLTPAHPVYAQAKTRRLVRQIEKSLLTFPPRTASAQPYIRELLQTAPNHPIALFWKSWIAIHRSQWDSAYYWLSQSEEGIALATHNPFYAQVVEDLPYIKGVLLLLQNRPEEALTYLRYYLQFISSNNISSRLVHPYVYRLFALEYTPEQIHEYLLLVPDLPDIVTARIEECQILQEILHTPPPVRFVAHNWHVLNSPVWEYAFIPMTDTVSVDSPLGFFVRRFPATHAADVEGLTREQPFVIYGTQIHKVLVNPSREVHTAVSDWLPRQSTGILYLGVRAGDLFFIRKHEQIDTMVLIEDPLPRPLNTPYRERTAFYLRNQQILLFVSNRPGGIGKLDLWFARRQPHKAHQWHVWNPGTQVNTPRNELSPFVFGDSILIFASDGYPRIGMTDLYITRIRVTQDTVLIADKIYWLPPPISSAAQDMFPWLVLTENDSFLLGWSSNRQGGSGGLDFYYVLLDEPNTLFPPASLKIDSLVAFLTRQRTLAARAPSSTGGLQSLSPQENFTGLEEHWSGFARGEAPPQAWQRRDTCLLLGIVYFAFGKHEIDPNFLPYLYQIADSLRKERLHRIRLVGHTDSIGSAVYNYHLGLQRARRVAQFFRAQGIVADQMIVTSLGETQPIASNKTEEGRQRNRRVEIIVCPSDI